MYGSITTIHMNYSGIKTYGFILGDDNKSYFFHKSNLQNCNINQLQEGDAVEFTPGPNPRNPQKMVANDVRKRATTSSAKHQYSRPGIHPKFDLDRFNEDEQIIIKALGKALFCTNSGDDIFYLGCNYRYFLIKPTEDYEVNFSLQREIPVVFSDYNEFDHRCLDVASKVAKVVPASLRLDRSCQIVICNDNSFKEKLDSLLRDSNLTSVVIPFTYGEFLKNQMNSSKIMDRFRNYLFDADLFTTSRPIKNDVFFFGRRDFALDIATKCKNSSYLCGVFGLRRSGKTSMLYAIQRQLESSGCRVVFIPCQEKLNTLNWKNALYQVTDEVCKVLDFPYKELSAKTEYEDDGANVFGADMDTMLEGQSTPIVLMFDEIEAITFGVGKSDSPWYDGSSYIHFWNILRGYCTRPQSKVSIVIAGTNPMINETPIIGDGKSPNPMFQQLSSSNQGSYLRPFDIPSTKYMIDTLGGYMGIKFNDSIPGKLVEDCGGHPYLIRLLCGQIYKYVREKGYDRPFQVSKGVYESVREEFEKSNEAISFYLMILEILQSSYPREYDALKILATDGDRQLSRVLGNAEIIHLTGYGLIEKNGDHFAIRFDTVKRFLQNKYRFERVGLSIEEQALEINTRMNDCELRLRALVRRSLNAHRNSLNPKQAFLDAMNVLPNITQKQRDEATQMTYRDLFDPTINGACYFLVIVTIIEKNFEQVFSSYFVESKSVVIDILKNRFNRYRKIPAHPIDDAAKNWSDQDFDQFRKDMLWLEGILQENE